MTPTKLLIGQILVVFAIVIAGVWAATQWAAAMLAYQPQLGLPWFTFFDTPVYRPWAIFAWWYHYDAYAPHVFDKAGMLAGASGFVGCAAAIFGSLWRARQQRHVTTYGSAPSAEAREMESAGLLGGAGAFLGRYHGRYAGLADKVDVHTWQLLKGVVLSTLLGVGAELSFGSSESDLVRAIRESAQQSGSRAGDQLVTRNLNIQPTIRVRAGWPLRIVVHKDIQLRPWKMAWR